MSETYSNNFRPGRNYHHVTYPDDLRALISADINEAQSIHRWHLRDVADTILNDGAIVKGGGIRVAPDTGVTSIDAGKIYIGGIVHDVPAAILQIPVDRMLNVGVVRKTEMVTYIDDPSLTSDLHLRDDTYGRPAASREKITVTWTFEGAVIDGDFFSVYAVENGVVLNNRPAQLEGVSSALRVYDREANGHYVVGDGWRVRAIGKDSDGKQVFSIGAGTVNIWGEKIVRDVDQRIKVGENPILENVEGEPHQATGAQQTLDFAHKPVREVTQVTIHREVSEQIIRSQTPNSRDPMRNTSIARITSVTQGSDTFIEGVDYKLTADRVDWTLGGVEPSPGSTYNITYQYIDTFVPEQDAWDGDQITIDGAVADTTILLEYKWALPRVDIIVADRSGQIIYIEGIASRVAPKKPTAPNDAIHLADVVNSWVEMPTVTNVAPHSIHYNQIDALWNGLYDLYDLVAQERLRRDAGSRESAESRGLFVDSFSDDDMRDQGVSQTLAIVDGMLMLPIEVTTEIVNLGQIHTLAHENDLLIEQPLTTGRLKINEHNAFDPLPAIVQLDPAIDNWVEQRTEWTSARTQRISNTQGSWGWGGRCGGPAGSEWWGRGCNSSTSSSTTSTTEQVRRRLEDAQFLRQISLTVSVSGFGGGEILDSATFDSVSVLPEQELAADADGNLTFAFVIPENIPTGQKELALKGRGGTVGTALFVGRGQIDVQVMRRVFTTTVTTVRRSNWWWGWGDPLAQTWVIPLDGGGRHISSVNVKFDSLGSTSNPVVCQIRETVTGLPNQSILAEATVDMAQVQVDSWTEFVFATPVYLDEGSKYSFVFLTDDNEHSLKIAEVGGFDAAHQRFVSAQTYTGGEVLTSADAVTWTPHQNTDLTMQVIAARFSETERTVFVQSIALQSCSDLLINLAYEEPGHGTAVMVRVTLSDGRFYRVPPGNVLQFDEYVTDDAVRIDLELTGHEKASPVIYSFIQIAKGTLAANGNYRSRHVSAGAESAVRVTFHAQLPGNSKANIRIGDGTTWDTLDSPEIVYLDDGWAEYSFKTNSYDLDSCVVDIVTEGSPRFRPFIRNLRMSVTPRPGQTI
ncbi:MAG: hypothetical protein DSY80_03910 [Desulfocapsa sp.]|nr:MAG: hypothetical protein DSY80_03910 [Desulfocapsa sp.]